MGPVFPDNAVTNGDAHRPLRKKGRKDGGRDGKWRKRGRKGKGKKGRREG